MHVGHDAERFIIGALCGIGLALASALLAGQHVEPHGSLAAWSAELAHQYWPSLSYLLHTPGRRGWATIVQFVGTTITFGGLFTAYLRAKYGLTVKALVARVWAFVRRQCAKLFRIPQHVIPKSGIAQGVTFGFSAVAVGRVGHIVDTSLSLQDQVSQLAEFVNRRSDELGRSERRLDEVHRAVGQARENASALAANALAHIEVEITQLRRDLDRVQVLDLRWAIAGLAISLVGIMLGYGT